MQAIHRILTLEGPVLGIANEVGSLYPTNYSDVQSLDNEAHSIEIPDGAEFIEPNDVPEVPLFDGPVQLDARTIEAFLPPRLEAEAGQPVDVELRVVGVYHDGNLRGLALVGSLHAEGAKDAKAWLMGNGLCMDAEGAFDNMYVQAVLQGKRHADLVPIQAPSGRPNAEGTHLLTWGKGRFTMEANQRARVSLMGGAEGYSRLRLALTSA